jgi:hypothetical protein
MNFETALPLLRAGVWIRCATWPKGDRLQLGLRDATQIVLVGTDAGGYRQADFLETLRSSLLWETWEIAPDQRKMSSSDNDTNL